MRILSDLQIEFIRHLAKSPLQDRFFLTGGTALSEFYLQHRYSEDLDFFTDDERDIVHVVPAIEALSQELSGKLEIQRNVRTIVQFFITRGSETLRCDFAFDSPYRLKPTILNHEFGIFIDNELDIACNKLSALFDRNTPKDFVDIFFIDKEIIPFEKLIVEARKKHVGLDNYWLAVSLAKVVDFDLLPRMIKPISLQELRKFFKQKAAWLMAG